MGESGARLVEVGTTNRTYLRDYEEAIGENTVALMRVHASNFRVVGFAESTPLTDMARVAHEHDLLLLDDIGSGCLVDTTQFGLAAEPTVQESLAAGADLVFFSGDKLLGGPQAGIIVGRKELVERLRRHPLARAVRMDKGSIAALAATAIHHLRGEAMEKVPVWQMISMPLDVIQRRANRWARAISAGGGSASGRGAPARVVDGRSMVGGGSLPEESLPTRLVAIAPPGETNATDLARRLRLGRPPVIARIERHHLLLDPRTVSPEEDASVIAAVKAALGGQG
jgi:L-seryl-tRNA(Ser) seleniumtransferase